MSAKDFVDDMDIKKVMMINITPHLVVEYFSIGVDETTGPKNRIFYRLKEPFPSVWFELSASDLLDTGLLDVHTLLSTELSPFILRWNLAQAKYNVGEIKEIEFVKATLGLVNKKTTVKKIEPMVLMETEEGRFYVPAHTEMNFKRGFCEFYQLNAIPEAEVAEFSLKNKDKYHRIVLARDAKVKFL